VYWIQHNVIKFVSDLGQVGGINQALRIPPPIKTDRHNITEILLKVALNEGGFPKEEVQCISADCCFKELVL
jgi:hypothetical protein